MSGKSEGGREARKPQQEQNEKKKGQAVPVTPVAAGVKSTGRQPQR